MKFIHYPWFSKLVCKWIFSSFKFWVFFTTKICFFFLNENIFYRHPPIIMSYYSVLITCLIIIIFNLKLFRWPYDYYFYCTIVVFFLWISFEFEAKKKTSKKLDIFSNYITFIINYNRHASCLFSLYFCCFLVFLFCFVSFFFL